jgi:hypothetical protein
MYDQTRTRNKTHGTSENNSLSIALQQISIEYRLLSIALQSNDGLIGN